MEFEGFTTCPSVSGNEAADILRRQGGHAPSYIATFQGGIERTVAVVTCNACGCVLVENELGGASSPWSQERLIGLPVLRKA